MIHPVQRLSESRRIASPYAPEMAAMVNASVQTQAMT